MGGEVNANEQEKENIWRREGEHMEKRGGGGRAYVLLLILPMELVPGV